MKLIFRYETSDGCIHTTEEAARKYCEEKRGEILVKHARKLVQMDQYINTLAYLEEFAGEIAESVVWHKEATAEIEEDEEDYWRS